MRQRVVLPQFERDIARMKMRGKDVEKLIMVVALLCEQGRLPLRFRPHKLRGEYQGLWECHLESDWLLIYELAEAHVLLHRTGTHADLFE